MNKIRLILAEDHVVVRQGVRLLLEQEKDMQVLGEVGDGLRLLNMAEILHPDVVVIDLKMPHLNGIETALELRRRLPNIKIVVLTMHADRSYINQALQAGVYGYVLKEEDIGEICTAIRKAAQGSHYLSPEVLRQVPGLPAGEPSSDPLMLLTRRERQVFHLVAEGKTNAEAAQLLGTSPRTVEVHRAHIRKKFNLAPHVDFMRFALKHGILTDEDQ